LYELLVGVLPFDPKVLRRAGYDEMRRIIREEDTPRPTARLYSLGAEITEIATRRKTTPDGLRKQLRGELDWITRKAMEKDRSRRYASVAGLAADIQCHLNDEPVQARPPSLFYISSKFIRRHKVVASAGALVACSLIAGIVVATSQARVADLQRHDAEWQSYTANVNAAELYLHLSDPGQARQRLLLAPSHLRGWEWRHLFLKTDASLATLHPAREQDNLDNYVEYVPRFAFNRSGDRVFWHTKYTLQGWDTRTYSSLARYGGLGTIVGIAADGTKVIAKASNGLYVVDTSSKQRLVSLDHKSEALFALFEAGSTRAAGIMEHGDLLIWDTISGRVLHSIAADHAFISCIAFSADGKVLATGSSDDTVKLWDSVSGRLLSVLTGHRARVRAIDFSPIGSTLATASDDGTIRIWEVPGGRSLLTIAGNYGGVYSVTYNPEGSKLVAGTEDALVHVWDAASGRHMFALTGNDYRVGSIAFTPDGTRIFTANMLGVWGPTLRVWDGFSEPGIKELRGHRRTVVFGIAFSSNDRFLASASFDGTVRIWDTGSGRTVRVLAGHRGGAFSVAFSPDGSYVASGSGDGVIRIWDFATAQIIRTIRAHDGQITALAFSPDGARLVSGSQDKKIKIWEVRSGRMGTAIVMPAPAGSVEFSPDGRHLLSGSGEQTPRIVQVWDAVSGKPTAILKEKENDGVGSDTILVGGRAAVLTRFG
jgi:WD40 repeat protein